MIRSVALLSFLIILGSCSNKSRFIEVEKVIGKNKNEVKEVLGKPDSVFVKQLLTKVVDVYQYDHMITHVRFNKNIAEEIIIYNPVGLEFSPTIISDFGLEYQKPAKKDEGVYYNWPSYNGYLNINLYAVGKKPYKGFEAHPGFEIYFSKRKN